MQWAGKKLLLTGANGMLAAALIPKLAQTGCELVLTDVVPGTKKLGRFLTLDISDAKMVRQVVAELTPDWILNCAAYTKVDDAERNQERAFMVNATGPGNLANAAKDHGSKVLHISTDYVFGGSGQLERTRAPFTEEDVPVPCGVYGHSKRLGDELLRATLPNDHIIMRTSWLHGVGGPNFVETMLRIGKGREELKVVNDQIGSPTWADWLADAMLGLLQKDARGLFNATSHGNISWFDFAKEIFASAGMPVRVLPQTTEELARPAPRPAYSVLDVSKLEDLLGVRSISWQEGVHAHLRALGVIKEPAAQ